MRPELETHLIASYAAVVGRDLVADAGGDLYLAPSVVLMHGIQADPIFCYANLTAQKLWGYGWDEFIALPSRLSAQPEAQADRERLLAQARVRGFIPDYAGIRIARDGRRFCISDVVLWNVTLAGVQHGQAAMFSTWTWLK